MTQAVRGPGAAGAADTTGATALAAPTALTADQARALARCAVVFEPGDPPRAGWLTFWDPRDPDGGPRLPEPAPGVPGTARLVVAGPEGPEAPAGPAAAPAARTVAVRRLTVGAALPVAALARREGGSPSAVFWGAALAVALHLVARERLLPGVSAGGYDAWRAGPLDPADAARLAELAAAMPAAARAVPVPVPGGGPLLLPEAAALVRAFADAVADTLPRTPAAALAAGRPAFAALAPQHVPQLRAWAEEIAAGLDSGVRLSLRLELAPQAAGEEAAALRLVPHVHSLADPALGAGAADLFADPAGAGLGPGAHADTVRALRRAAEVWPPLARLLPVPSPLVLTGRELGDLLGGAAGRLRAQGVDVLWPTEATRGLTARAVVGARRTPPADPRAFFGPAGDGTVDVTWHLALDGEPLTDEETARVAAADGPLVRLRGRWVLVDADLARTARDRELAPLTAIEALAVALTGHARLGGERVPVAPSPWLDALRRAVTEPSGDGPEPPAALAATLRDYQLQGLRWLDRMTSLGLGGCLADDMGLGKTVQLIALHLLRQERAGASGPTLVVCPASLLGNWEREVARFAPGTPVRRYHGPGRTLDGATAGFVLTTYGTMRLDAAELGAHRWGLVVADEAQHVKNPASGTARALRRVPAGARVALTGTPVENDLTELWSILDWTTPGLLGGLTSFRRHWMAPIEAERAAAPGDGPEPGDGPAARRLADLVRPFLLRRRKSDPHIAPELPAKTETDHPVTLTGEQRALYERHTRETLAAIAGSGGGLARSGLVLRLLTGLKQICNHPAQFLKEDTAAALLPGRSGKLELLDELLSTVVSSGGAALVFTQYVTMARLLQRHLADRGLPALLLHGGTPVRRREELVRRFQAGEAPVFLLSLKAAGTGLNLTRADHVVHYDRWWNPAVEAQATDRAYRIGQTRPVQVHRLIAEGTVEDRIAELLAAKQGLADAIVGAGAGAAAGPAEVSELARLSDEELARLVELGPREPHAPGEETA